MIQWFKQLDEVLRGDTVRNGGLNSGQGRVSLRGLTLVAILLNALYGLSVGSFTAIRTGGEQLMQMVASAVKLPMLFGFTLLVTLPSLYVFSALVGARLRFGEVCRLLAAMIGVVAAVLASFAPIVVFFGISTTSYPFMKLLIVVMCGVAGVLGLAFLLRTLQVLVITEQTKASELPEATSSETAEAKQEVAVEAASADTAKPQEAGAPANPAASKKPEPSPQQTSTFIELDPVPRQDRRARSVFRIWVLLFGVVGMQMSWILRPFIGHPELEFAWFRARESNFFTDVLEAIGKLMGL